MFPFSVQRIDHLVFRVQDVARSVAFYADVLGCNVVRRRDDLGLIHLRVGVSMVDLISIDGKLGRVGGAGAGVEGRNVDHLCLRIDPFDKQSIVLHLAKHGIAPHGPAASNFGAEGEGLSLYFDDPDGNTIELKGPSVAFLCADAPLGGPMSVPLHDLEAEILNLPPEDRVRLLERLIASFEPKSSSQRAWLDLALERQADVKAGKVSMVPGEAALDRVRARIA